MSNEIKHFLPYEKKEVVLSNEEICDCKTTNIAYNLGGVFVFTYTI